MTRPEPNYRCPVCDAESAMILGPEQAFCTNRQAGPDGCPVLLFNPSLPDGGLSDPQVINLDEL